MNHFKLHLKDHFPILGENSKNPYVEVYSPTNMDLELCRDAKRPCLVILPGGGYSRISPREAEPLALHFLPLGYHTFVVHYTPGPEHNFPTQLREVAAVIELIHQNADQWLCDTEHIAIMGFSAGGHLAAHYTNGYDWPEVQEMFPSSHPVHACVLAYPVISADPAVAHVKSFENLLGRKLSPEEQARFSCNNMVTDRTPPTFLWHTAADQLVPVENSLLYAQALAQHKVPFEVHIFPNGQHGLGTVKSDPAKPLQGQVLRNRAWLELARTWLDITFGIE